MNGLTYNLVMKPQNHEFSINNKIKKNPHC